MDNNRAVDTFFSQQSFTATDIAQFLTVLDGFHASTPIVRGLLRFMTYVPARPADVLAARWEDIDMDGGMWRFTSIEANLDHAMPLPPQAIEILRKLKQKSHGWRYIFPHSTNTGQPMSEQLASQVLRLLHDTLTLGDFRVAARTALGEIFGKAEVKRVLSGRASLPGIPDRGMEDIGTRTQMIHTWAETLDRIIRAKSLELLMA